MVKNMNKKMNTAANEAALRKRITQLAQKPTEALFGQYNSHSVGLSQALADQLLAAHGPNVIQGKKAAPWPLQLLMSMVNPFSLVLMVIAAVSFVVDVSLAPAGQKSYATFWIIWVMIVVSGALEFFTKRSSQQAADTLKKLVHNTATVLRDGIPAELPMAQVVPGDVVLLSAGDMLPADVRILQSKDLFIRQAALTGESEAVEKSAVAGEASKTLTDISNICFFGCDVVSGSGAALVLATGNETYLAMMAHTLVSKRAQSSFEKGVSDVSKLLMRMMFVMLPIILVANGVIKRDWMGALLFAMSLAVGLTPEMLPVILSSTLARGAMVMSKKKTIIKNPSAIQSFGAMDVLCTDKTGTLTEDKIVLEKYLDVHGQEDLRVLRYAYFNSLFQTGMKNLIDVAIMERAQREGLEQSSYGYTKVDEIPFDFSRRRMSVVLMDQSKQTRLITKGAIEEMLSICTRCEYQGSELALDDALRAEILQVSGELNDQGLRVLGIARKNEVAPAGAFDVADEQQMVLIGFVAFLDPPKPSAAEAIRALEEHGVRTVVLTGDNERVSRTICAKVGLDVSSVLLGEDVDAMEDAALLQSAQHTAVFAKLSPQQKARVVAALQAGGHTVGYMGDGINDVSAMYQADVGISVDGAVDIAKETADVILLEKSLMVLERGVVEGRRTFGNIVKYIKMAASGNFGNIFSVLIASVFLPFLPMLPVQLLAQNLLYDFSQLAIPVDTVDEEYLRKPRKWDAKDIARYMFTLGPVSSLFDILAFVVLYYAMGFKTPQQAAYFQTGWFVVGLVSQTLIVHLIRTSKKPFLQSRAAWPLMASTLLVAAAGLIIPYTFVGTALDMARLPGVFYLWLIGILAGYALVVELVKKHYVKRHGQWL